MSYFSIPLFTLLGWWLQWSWGSVEANTDSGLSSCHQIRIYWYECVSVLNKLSFW